MKKEIPSSKGEIFDRFRAEAARSSWVLPPVGRKSIGMHVRLDDLRDSVVRTAVETRKQGFMGRAKLKELLRVLSRRFPGHDIHIVTSPNKEDRQLCAETATAAGVVCGIQASRNVDEDLFYLMNCDILVLSRSTFGFVAALLHQGSLVFTSDEWDHLDELLGRIPDAPEGASVSSKVKPL